MVHIQSSNRYWHYKYHNKSTINNRHLLVVSWCGRCHPAWHQPSRTHSTGTASTCHRFYHKGFSSQTIVYHYRQRYFSNWEVYPSSCPVVEPFCEFRLDSCCVVRWWERRVRKPRAPREGRRAVLSLRSSWSASETDREDTAPHRIYTYGRGVLYFPNTLCANDAGNFI